ncbi:hypothetical protein [Clostridium sp.]|uniref:hypothetical protein n=1 Tax=Clostridium sp. TaxID=1506 RepID=UPI003216BCE3
MKVGVKYCGGCNPLFNRSNFLNQIKKNSRSNVEFYSVKNGEVYDGVVVLCGCKSRCAEYKDIQYRNFLIVVDSQKDYPKVLEKVGESSEY